MNNWKKHISTGNWYFDKKDYESARKHYCQAIGRADQLFFVWFDPDEAVWALIVSYQNLADLYEKQGKPRRSLAIIQELYEILQKDLSKLNNGEEQDDLRLQALTRGLNCTHTHLARLCKATRTELHTTPTKSNNDKDRPRYIIARKKETEFSNQTTKENYS
ncbi:hypothetical protein TDB9533_00361 [Thalassocella blandensis]|nr:hypothetical protein TDB9533_00361 [Thalassocella blandensis]